LPNKSNDNEVIFLNKINIFETLKTSNNFTKIEDTINIKFIGFYGGVNLESGIVYKIKVKPIFGENLLEIKKCKMSIEKHE
jgi:hypothetical protein